jgi:aminoglycoside phosphotransferase family enzyme/predicted kinase
MQTGELIRALSDPAAYPFSVSDIEVKQTHISMVFLAGEFVYKVKKPVKLSFLDFSTFEKRRHFCEEEVRLNRRLAPDVYLGVVPITGDGAGLCFEGAGEPVDWAVKMRRLSQEATLERRLARNALAPEGLVALARRLADFHRMAARSDHISEFGRFDTVARNIRENFAVAAPLVGQTMSRSVRDRLISLTEESLSALRAVIDTRATQNVPCDTHGDLHLDHVYLFPDRQPPGDLIVVDCIEFNERFRYADPVADMAFLAMDLAFHGRSDLADVFADAWFEASGDVEGRGLLPLYVSYRAAVRGKVDGLQLVESEIPEAARARALSRAHGHWLLALNTLESPGRRVCLVLVGGLPGTGKSSLAASLAAAGNFRVIRSDVVRKELAGIACDANATAPGGAEIYTREWTDRTYAECLRRAEDQFFDGERVIIDATFVEEGRRQTFLDAAVRWGIPALFLICKADEATVQARLESRRGDASDADWLVYREAARRWDEPKAQMVRITQNIWTGASPEAAIDSAWKALVEFGLAGEGAQSIAFPGAHHRP